MNSSQGHSDQRILCERFAQSTQLGKNILSGNVGVTNVTDGDTEHDDGGREHDANHQNTIRRRDVERATMRFQETSMYDRNRGTTSSNEVGKSHASEDRCSNINLAGALALDRVWTNWR